MFSKKANIEDVSSCLRISEKHFAYYSRDYKLKILDSELLTLQLEYQFSRDFDYKIHADRLFFSLDNELHTLSLSSPTLEKVCHTQKQYIIALSASRYLASSYQRKDKRYENSIFDASCKLLWEESGEMAYRDVYEEHILLSDRRGVKIGYLNFEDCRILWQRELERGIDGDSIETNNSIIIPLLGGSLGAFSRQNGTVLWQLENALSFYNYDASNCKLYGIGGKTFVVINAQTGEREIQHDLSENLHISSPHLAYYDNGLLYFSAYRDKNIPVLGAVDVENGKLLFTQEVEIEGEKSFRKGLDQPTIVGNRLYVRDAMKTLHIFERE